MTNLPEPPSLLESIKHHAELILKYPGQCDYEAAEILTLIRNYQDAQRPKNMLGFPMPQTLNDLRNSRKGRNDK